MFCLTWLTNSSERVEKKGEGGGGVKGGRLTAWLSCSLYLVFEEEKEVEEVVQTTVSLEKKCTGDVGTVDMSSSGYFRHKPDTRVLQSTRQGARRA